ncbi:hypothetical protein [Bacillus sp. EB600]|nr:hypothetical protein [Bacillus sp. EB600]MCQ6283011.1 hypothetical protein [Bacillus sp. EB600]
MLAFSASQVFIKQLASWLKKHARGGSMSSFVANPLFWWSTSTLPS